MATEKAGSETTEVKPNAFGVIPDVDKDTELPASEDNKKESSEIVEEKGKVKFKDKPNEVTTLKKRLSDTQRKMHESTTKASLLEKELDTLKKFQDLLPFADKLKKLKESEELGEMSQKEDQILDEFIENPDAFLSKLKKEIYDKVSDEMQKKLEEREKESGKNAELTRKWIDLEEDFKNSHPDYVDLVPAMKDEFNRLLELGIDARNEENPPKFLYNQVKGNLSDEELTQLKERKSTAEKTREKDNKMAKTDSFTKISPTSKKEITDEGDKIVALARKQGMGSLF